MARSAASFQIASSLSSTVCLNDGVFMPLFGLGLFRAATGTETQNAITFALQNGYRLLDTAQVYKNESDVPGGIKNSGLSRSDIFIVTKIWNSNHGYSATTASFLESLSKLETNYVDLCLIHSPLEGKNIETYQALLDLKKKGQLRSIGVSNFGVHHLKGLQEAGLPEPSVNQIQLHPFNKTPDLVQYCQDNCIALMGYTPLIRGQKDNDPDLVRIAQRMKKSVAQVLIRWSVQMGFSTIPKSTKPERILSNAQVFDFELSQEDMAILNEKPDGHVIGWNPVVSPWNG